MAADPRRLYADLPGPDRDRRGLAFPVRQARAEALAWRERYRSRMESEGDRTAALNAVNPKYVLRNWVAETAIRAVEDRGDCGPLDRILKLVQSPYDAHAGEDALAEPPAPEFSRAFGLLLLVNGGFTARKTPVAGRGSHAAYGPGRHGTIQEAGRRRRPPQHDQCRHRHDHPQAIPENHPPHRPGQGPVRRDALQARRQRESGFRAQQAGLSQGADPGGGREFRLRLLAASTRPGRCWISASAASSRPASPTSSTTIASRTASCRSSCRRTRSTS